MARLIDADPFVTSYCAVGATNLDQHAIWGYRTKWSPSSCTVNMKTVNIARLLRAAALIDFGARDFKTDSLHLE